MTTIPLTESMVDSPNLRQAQAIVDRYALPAAFVATAILGALGATGSFMKVSQAAVDHHINPSWLLPLGVDGAIAVFTGLDLVLAREGKRVGWLRWFAWALIAVTVALNVVGEKDLFGLLAHAALPLLWAATVEAAKAAMVTKQTEAVDRIPVARWVYAPLRTLALHRRMRLWQITSYASALGREQERALAKCDLIEKHGYTWRWSAPRRERELYRLGLLAPQVADVPEPQGLGEDVGDIGTPVTITKFVPVPRPRAISATSGPALQRVLADCRAAAERLGIPECEMTRPKAREAGVKGKTEIIGQAVKIMQEAKAA